MKKIVSLVCAIALILSVFCVTSIGTVSTGYAAPGYPYGISSAASNQSEADRLLQQEWQSWKNTYVTSSGAGGYKRIQRDGSTNFDTVSEGMGYGMLLAVSFGEQSLFNDLYGYVKKYFNGNGLMGWHIDAQGRFTTHDGGSGAATDADEDIALALVFAHKKWGSNGAINYEQEAKTLINNIYTHMIEKNTYVVKNGDGWGGSDNTNPSYYAPAWYRIFAQFTGNQDWIKVANKCYEIVNNIKRYNNNTGLVPDWCTAQGTPASGMGYDYKYDAVRYGWRTAIDYSWFGTADAKSNCDALTNFFKRVGITNIKDGYTITGNTVGQWHTSAFTSCAAAGAMTSDLSTARAFYDECVKIKDGGDYHYFGNTLRMMVLLYITGNFPNLMSGAAPSTPVVNPTPNTGGNNGSSKYPYGISSAASNQSEADRLLQQEWQSWKNTYVTSSGAGGYKRIQRDGSTNFDTVSEGMGYGMILAVSFGEQALFNDLYGYVKKYFNGNGLMGWHIDAQGRFTTHDGGSGAATDADEDIALALVFAHKKWGSNGAINYEQEAKTLINNIYNHMIERGTYVVKNGDGWGGSDNTNPSYYAPAWYRIFAQFTGNQDWIKVANKCYEIVNNIKRYNNNTGLVPDWCTAQGTPASGMGYDYKYDAVRYGWRTAIDYSWFGTADAKANCDALTNFFKRVGVTNIKDGYTITGNTVGQWHTSAFTSCAAAGAMTSDFSTAKEFYDECVKIKDGGDYHYFGNTLRMMVLLYITGNFPNLMSGAAPSTPVVNPTPTPNGSYIPGDVDGSGSFNSIDFGYVRQYLLGSIREFPGRNGFQAADVDKNGTVNSIDFGLMRQVLLGMRSGF